jgi:hypothetical protein
LTFKVNKSAHTNFTKTAYVLPNHLSHSLKWLLVKPGTPEQRNTGTASFRNTGTLKILNLLKIREKNTGGCESIAAIIIA